MGNKIQVKSPNKYNELIKEISSDDILEGFIGYGLFPEKIPGFLSSKAYYEKYLELGKPQFEDKGKDYIRYESMRNINVPRLMAVPNPFAYSNLCKSVSDNWETIKNHLNQNVENQKFKVSRIHIRKFENGQHLFEMNYKHLTKDGIPEQDIIIGKQYCVEADISGCFPSIYSHAIPWALVGKETAKLNKDNKGVWYNKLDRTVRNTKNEETNGILIGPHCSNLLAELILTRVDHELTKKGYKYIRNIDDYECYVESMPNAENFILDLSSELKKFELHLNNKKTRITSLPKASVSDWVHKLNNYDIGSKLDKDGKIIFELKRLRAFIDLAVELMLRENNSAVLNYAFKVVATKSIGANAYSYYVNYIHHLLLLYPYLCHIVDEFVFIPFEVKSSKINKISNDLFKIGLTKKHFEACSYSVFWALKFDFTLEFEVVKEAIESNDCVFMTLASLYAKKNKDSNGIKKLKKKAKELKNSDIDLFWLFIYEVLPPDSLEGDFKRFKKEKVSFIQSEYQYK